ncbi:MAG: cytochrome-c oxidase [Deltaproteobacteria bacterium]|nr:cytochrome-c oxidase [Deltaproteobacteria bacterium]
MEKKNNQDHETGYGTYFFVWITLLLFTVITVSVSLMQLGKLSVLSALVIASIKATLVLAIFMHLKYEKRLFKVMFFVTIMTLTVFIGMTFFDILYR